MMQCKPLGLTRLSSRTHKPALLQRRKLCCQKPQGILFTCCCCRKSIACGNSRGIRRDKCQKEVVPKYLQTDRRRDVCLTSLREGSNSIEIEAVVRPPLEADQPIASTSARSNEFSTDDREKLARAVAIAPLAALSLGAFKTRFEGAVQYCIEQFPLEQLAKLWTRLKDSANYAYILPPVGSQQISYARFLELLSNRKIKRIILMDNGTCAIVEIPVDGYAASYKVPLLYDRDDEIITYHGASTPESEMEKIRYYVELPGDLYEDGYFMDLVKIAMGPLRTEEGRVPQHLLLRQNQTYLELQVVDSSEASTFLDSFQEQLYPIFAILALSFFVGLGGWIQKVFGGKKKMEKEEVIDEYSRFKGTLYNVEGGSKGTGVRYEDVAGVEHAMSIITETVEQLTGKTTYAEMGAKPARGILMEGPPGTGKTFLAKAMAGESGLPFISTNGSEFVEMFQGVAASRVKDLFKVARRIAPSIVFIDEIDSIGKQRLDGDQSSSEQQNGLLQLLYEMDSYARDDRVLVIGATNQKQSLDDALLRPGRFDRSIHMGLPGEEQRFKILQVHARDKSISRAGDDRWPEDALLRRTAELTVDYSGAALANLMNEAAILMVRRDKGEIDLQIINEVMDKKVLGSAASRLPESAAKRQLALISAARAVVIALTPGMPQIQRVTIRPRGEALSRTLFMPQDSTTRYQLSQPGKWNAVELTEPLSPYETMSGLLVPLYAARAAEEAFYGPEGVTLSTSSEIAEATTLASFLVTGSMLFPAYRDRHMMHNLLIGGEEDPTVQNRYPEHEEYIQELQTAAHSKALRIVRERRPTIERVADEMCSSSDDTISGSRIVDIIESTPLQLEPATADQAGNPGFAFFGSEAGRTGCILFGQSLPQSSLAAEPAPRPAIASFAGESEGRCGTVRFDRYENVINLASETLEAAMEVVIGRADLQDIISVGFTEERFTKMVVQLAEQDATERLEALRRFARSTERRPDFPPPPPLPYYLGGPLEEWYHAEERVPVPL